MPSVARAAASLLFAVVAVSWAPPAVAASPIVGPFSVIAERVTFYSNRYVISADENVRLDMADGTKISGDTFSMDLRLNRFVIAGNVRLIAPDGTETDGAAFSEFFDFDRSYFIPLTNEPDRWTFTEADFKHPILGREMPGDTFFLPDLSSQRVFLQAGRAYIVPRESVRFTPAKINFGLTFVQFPEYFLNFSINPNFEQNSLPGAFVDGPLDFLGGSHVLATAHIRYDSTNKLFPAFELHQVSERHYIVASINPITRPQKQYNVLAFDRISPKVQAQLSLQESAFQQNFQQPLAASAYTSLQVTAGLKQSFLQLSAHQYYQSLLAMPKPINGGLYYGDPSHNFVPDHPNDVELSWTGFQHDLVPRKLYYQLRSGIGVAHTSPETSPTTAPLASLGGVSYPTIWNHYFGGTLIVPSLPVQTDTHGQKLFFNASYDRQYQYYSEPHVTDTQSESVSFSKVYNWKFDAFVSYTIQNTRDNFGKNQDAAYPAYTTPIISSANGLPYNGYAGFRGFATSRSLLEQFVYNPAGPLNFVLFFRENRDFPGPIPEPVGGPQYGVPPYQASLDVRYRLNRIVTLDISRSYYFNFGGYLRYSPTFGIQVLR